MKINTGALIRLLLAGLIINIALQAAEASFAIQIAIAFLLGLAYPESAFVIKKESKDDKQNN